MRVKLTYGLVFFLTVCSLTIYAVNPLIRDAGISDPHIRVFNGKIYLYSGHDKGPDDKDWIMNDWRVYTSTDLVKWTLEDTISPKENYMNDDSHDCWAGDAATRNGMYYFYFSDRTRGIGVMSAPTPIGPFKDALGKPLVSPMHDPTILTDDGPDQFPYIIYGDKKGSYHVAKLNNDMISLAEPPKPIKILGEQWDNAPEWMDKNYIFKRNGVYYLSWGRDYATSTNIYGPYQCIGAVGTGHQLSSFAHGSFFEWKGQFYHIWCYYLKPGFKYRESIITYCHFDEQGHIFDDTNFLDKHFSTGVGQYDATWDVIQAEWFYEKSAAIEKKVSAEGGYELSNLENGSWLKFANMDFNVLNQSFTARISNSKRTSKIEVRVDGLNGKLLASIMMPDNLESGQYASVSCKLGKITGKQDLYLKFVGAKGNLLNLNWFSFVEQKK